MNDKPLTVQALKKLSQMSYEDKVRLFARCCILRQNSQIAGILTRAVGPYERNDVKAEIVHHLYDENDQYRYSRNYNELLDNMMNKQNIYNKFDDYTLCAFMVYYDRFIALAESARNINDIRYAKEKAYNYVLKYIDRDLLNMDYVENPNLKTESMLKKEYRRALVSYLAKDLNIKKGFDFVMNYLTGEFDMQEAMEEYNASRPALDPNKTYANQVEEYRGPNGTVYYMDADGNVIDYNEIEDFNINGITLSATKNGVVEYYNNRDNEY